MRSYELKSHLRPGISFAILSLSKFYVAPRFYPSAAWLSHGIPFFPSGEPMCILISLLVGGLFVF